MKQLVLLVVLMITLQCAPPEADAYDKKNVELAQLFLDNILTDGEKAKSLLHEEFSFSWMGIIEQGGKIWNRDNLFDVYFKEIIPEILPNGIVLKTVDFISDKKGVALIQEGEAEGKNGEYNNKYVWIFKMKDGLIHSIREYNSDILVATRLYDYKLVPLEGTE